MGIDADHPEPHPLARRVAAELADSDALAALLQEYAEHSASEHTSDWHAWRDGWLVRVKAALEGRR